MKSWAKWTATAVLATTAFAAAGGALSGVAQASVAGGNNSGNNGPVGGLAVLAGNRALIPVGIPINVCGNAVSVLGLSLAGCRGGAAVLGGAAGALAGDVNGLVAGVNLPDGLPVDQWGRGAGGLLPGDLAGLGILPCVADLPILAGLGALPLAGVAGV